jgi:hypothetical protein
MLLHKEEMKSENYRNQRRQYRYMNAIEACQRCAGDVISAA